MRFTYLAIILISFLLIVLTLFVARNRFIKSSTQNEIPTLIIVDNQKIEAIKIDAETTKPWRLNNLKTKYSNTPVLFVIPKGLPILSWATNIKNTYNIYWISDNTVLSITENIIPITNITLRNFYGSDELYIKPPQEAIDFILEIPVQNEYSKKIKIGDKFYLSRV